MLLLKIYDKNKVFLGEIDFKDNNPYFVSEFHDQQLEGLITKSAKEGLGIKIDEFNLENNSSKIMETKIVAGENLFPIALRDFLKNNGYIILERNTDIQEKITSILADFPDDNADKIDILSRLKNMSLLEQTALLSELENEKF